MGNVLQPRVEVFSKMLISTGEYFGNPSDPVLYQTSISHIHSSFAFADKELCDLLWNLRFEVTSFNNLTNQKGNAVTGMDALQEVAININKLLSPQLIDE